MIEFKKYFENISEKEYRAAHGLSYSFLKELDNKGPSIIRDGIEHKSSDGLTLGSVVDSILTDKEFNVFDNYYLSDIKLDLSGTTHIAKILRYLKDNDLKIELDHDFTEIYSILEIKRPPKLDDGFWRQVDLLNADKPVLYQEEYELALQMVETFNTHQFTSHIFNAHDELEVIDQAIVFFEYNGIKCKSMLDKVIIDHYNKVIYPKDIKTGAAPNFMTNFYQYKYYLQGAMYSEAILQLINNNKLEGYTVAPFEFIYVSRVNPNVPQRYIMTYYDIEKASYGWDTNAGYHKKGVIELINDYKWYLNNDEFDYKRELIENNGVVEINLM